MPIRQINRNNRSVNYTLPAPVGGLNARDSLDTMSPTDAIVLDNYIPGDTNLFLRRGYSVYVKNDKRFLTLASYSKYNEPRFIGIADGKAYNISSKKNVTQYEGISFTDSRCQTVQYKDRLFFFNGVDTPKVFYVDDGGEDQAHKADAQSGAQAPEEVPDPEEGRFPHRPLGVGVALEEGDFFHNRFLFHLWEGERTSLPLGEGGPKGRMRGSLAVCFTLLIERLPLFAWGATTRRATAPRLSPVILSRRRRIRISRPRTFPKRTGKRILRPAASG